MPRSFPSLNILSSLLLKPLNRRGYAVTSEGVGSKGGGMKSGEEKVAVREKDSWVPDPVTGYYKPENSKEIDVAELRATLLGKRFNN